MENGTLLSDKDLLCLLKRNRNIKVRQGTEQHRITFFDRTVNRQTLRNVTYDTETKRIGIKFVLDGKEHNHEVRLKRTYPPMLDELVGFLEYKTYEGLSNAKVGTGQIQ